MSSEFPQAAVNPSGHAINVPTMCPLCSHTCGLRVDVKDNQIVAVRGDETAPNTQGYTCNKAQAINLFAHHAQRVQHPMKRQADGSFQRISWDQAIAEIAAKLNGIRSKHPSRSIALTGIGGQGSHIAGFGSLPFMFAIKSPTMYTALAQEKTQHPMVWRHMFGVRSNVYMYSDEEHADYIISMGANPLISNRGRNATEVFRRLATDPQRKLVVIDPRVSEVAKRADRHIAIQPGRDVYFLMGMAAVIVQEQLHNKAFVSQYVKDYAAFAEPFRHIDAKQMADWCGVSQDDLLATAREFAASQRGTINYDTGLEHSFQSTLTSYLIHSLLVITGHVCKPEGGGSAFLEQFGFRVPDMVKPAKTLVSGVEAVQCLLPIGVFPPNTMPEDIETSHPARIRALIVDGANPLVSYADSNAFRGAFKKLELLVVIEPSMTETARVADYVLPARPSFEKWNYSMFPHEEVTPQLVPPILKPQGEALPEVEIYQRLARAMGLVPKVPKLVSWLSRYAVHPRWHGVGAPLYMAAVGMSAAVRGGGILAIAGRIVHTMYDSLGQHLPAPDATMVWLLCLNQALFRKKVLHVAMPETRGMHNPFKLSHYLFKKMLAHPEGVLVGPIEAMRASNLTDNLLHPDRKIHLPHRQWLQHISQLAKEAPRTDADYPLMLNGGMRTGWNANTILRDPSWRKGKGPHCPIIISPADAARLSLKNGDMVRLETRRGHVDGPVRIDQGTMTGHLHIPNGFGLEYPDPQTGELVRHGIRINELTDIAERDPYTAIPYLKRTACRLTPIVAQEPSQPAWGTAAA